MHIGRDNQFLQPIVNAPKPPIGVIEKRCAIEQDFKENHRHRRCADKPDCRRLNGDADQCLARVKAQARGYIKIAVAVMRAVQTPKQWNFVKGAVMPIKNKIEQNDAGEKNRPIGQGHQTGQITQQAAARSEESQCRQTAWHNQAHNHAIQQSDEQITDRMRWRYFLRAARQGALQQKKQRQ